MSILFPCRPSCWSGRCAAAKAWFPGASPAALSGGSRRARGPGESVLRAADATLSLGRRPACYLLREGAMGTTVWFTDAALDGQLTRT
jgi:hypothetical protein